ncbi:hypothetical protein Tco_0581889 [Tanacetum coccineum]
MRPPGFNQPNVQSNQTNQNRYQGNNFNSNQNRGGNFNQNRQNNQGAVYQAPPYQPPTNQPLVNQALPPVSQIQGVSKTDFESYAKANDANMNNLQMKLDNFQRNQNDFQRSYNDSQKKQDDFQNLMLGFMQNYHNNSTASTSRPGTLPSQTVTNPREHVNAITTRSGKTLEGPSTPLVPTPVVSNPQKEPEQNPETSTEKVQNPNLENTAQVPPPEEEESIFMEIPKPKAKKTVNVDPNSPNPNSYQSKLPYHYPDEDEIGLKDALVEMPKFNKWLSGLLRNKEKLEEIAITTVNAECSAIIMNKVPRCSDFQEKFFFPCGFTKSSKNYSSPVKTSDNFEKFADELALLDLLPPGNDDSTLKKVECFAPENNNDEIDDFLAMEVSSNFEEGYFDSEGDITFLDNLLSDDAFHNLASECLLVRFTIPRSQGNVHANQSLVIESLPISPIPVEDSEPTQEEIDIFLVPDDLIPPGVENDDSEDEVNESPNLDHQDDPSIPRPPPEPPDIEKCFKPEAGILITKEFKGVSKPHEFMAYFPSSCTRALLKLS